jgi:hypothetical protein
MSSLRPLTSALALAAFALTVTACAASGDGDESCAAEGCGGDAASSSAASTSAGAGPAPGTPSTAISSVGSGGGPGDGGAGGDGGSGDVPVTAGGGSACADTWQACEGNADCCGYPEGSAWCVDEGFGKGPQCHAGCSEHTDCESVCCTSLDPVVTDGAVCMSSYFECDYD